MDQIVAGLKAVLIVGLVNASEVAGEGIRGGELQITEQDRRMICREGARGGASQVGDPFAARLFFDIFRVTHFLGKSLLTSDLSLMLRGS